MVSEDLTSEEWNRRYPKCTSRLCNKYLLSSKNQRKNSDRYSTASSEGDSSDNDDKRLSGPPLSPPTPGPGLGRISETTEEESMIEEETTEELLPQAKVVSPSQA